MGDTFYFLKKLAAEIEKDESKSKPESKGDKPEAKGKSDKKPPFGKKEGGEPSAKDQSSDEQGNGGGVQAGNPAAQQGQAPTSEAGESEVPGNESAEGPAAQGSAQFDPRIIIDFFASTPNPTDEQYHEFAESQGLDIHAAEQIAYALAGKFVMFLRGGRSQGVIPEGIDPAAIEQGMQIESEHSDDPATQKKITLDHLTEDPQYYDKLAQMEGGQAQDSQQTEQSAETNKKNSDQDESNNKFIKGQQTEGDRERSFQS